MELNDNNKRKFGSAGEKAAAEFLVKEGYKILSCNYRFGRLGEIDIIAYHNEYICFIEVKTRSSMCFGSPAEAVNRKKQDNIRKIASIYINQHKLYNCNIRFDIVEIIACKRNNALEVKNINLLQNAF